MKVSSCTLTLEARMWPDKTIEADARHEAGHAVAMVCLGQPFTWVVLNEEERGVRRADRHPDFLDVILLPPRTYEEACDVNWPPDAQAFIRREMVAFAAGPLAQMQYEGRAFPDDISEFYQFGGGQDAQCIRRWANGLVAPNASTKGQANERRRALIKACVRKARHLVTSEQGRIEVVARNLINVGRLSRDEVVEQMR